jgi:hypothetical protein
MRVGGRAEGFTFVPLSLPHLMNWIRESGTHNIIYFAAGESHHASKLIIRICGPVFTMLHCRGLITIHARANYAAGVVHVIVS